MNSTALGSMGEATVLSDWNAISARVVSSCFDGVALFLDGVFVVSMYKSTADNEPIGFQMATWTLSRGVHFLKEYLLALGTLEKVWEDVEVSLLEVPIFLVHTFLNAREYDIARIPYEETGCYQKTPGSLRVFKGLLSTIHLSLVHFRNLLRVE